MQEKQENRGLSLLKTGQKGIVRVVFSRMALILILLLVQALVLFSVFRWFEAFLPHIFGGVILFSAVMILYLLNSRQDASAKITWLILIMLMPVFGALLYLYTMYDPGHRTLRKRTEEMIAKTRTSLTSNPDTMGKLKEESPGSAALAHYIQRSGCFPVYENTEVTYFPMGEKNSRQCCISSSRPKNLYF